MNPVVMIRDSYLLRVLLNILILRVAGTGGGEKKETLELDISDGRFNYPVFLSNG